MVDAKERKSLFIRALVALGIAAVTCIPFTLSKVTLAEIIIKYIVFALAIAVLTIMGIASKYRYYRPSVKFTTVVTYTPLFSYVAAVLFNTVLILARTNVYSAAKSNVLLMFIPVVLVVAVFLSHVYFKFQVLLSKNESMLCDAIFGVLSVVYLFACAGIAVDYMKVGDLGQVSFMFLLVGILVGAIFFALHFFILKGIYEANDEYVVCDRDALLASKTSVKKVVMNKTVVKTNTIVNTVKEVVTLKNTEEIEALNARIDELDKELDEALNVISSYKAKILETLQKCADNDQELILNSLNESYAVISNEHEVVKEEKARVEAELGAEKAALEAQIKAYEDEIAEQELLAKEAEEKAKLEAERRLREAEERAKERKPLEPAPSFFVEAIDGACNGLEGVEKVEKEDGSQVRYTFNGKLFANIQVTNNDYRFQFASSTADMQVLMSQYSRDLVYDRTVHYNVSNADLEIVKAVYKGEESLPAEAVKEFLLKALETVQAYEVAEEQAKEEVKAQKEREKAAYQALREKEKAEEKAAREALKEAEKLAKEQEKQNENDEALVEDKAA